MKTFCGAFPPKIRLLWWNTKFFLKNTNMNFCTLSWTRCSNNDLKHRITSKLQQSVENWSRSFTHSYLKMFDKTRSFLSESYVCCIIFWLELHLLRKKWTLIRRYKTSGVCYMSSLVETAWTFYMFLKVTNLIFHDFIQFSKKRPCNKTSLIWINFIKLPIKCILNLAAILRRKVLQVSLRRLSNFESSWDRHQFYRAFNANKLQSHYKFQNSVIFSVLFE